MVPPWVPPPAAPPTPPADGDGTNPPDGADPDGTHAHLVTDPGSLEGHGGSHPHLVHEFVSALFEDRDPFPDSVRSANITCAGLLAHESAINGGARIRLPDFAFRRDVHNWNWNPILGDSPRSVKL